MVRYEANMNIVYSKDRDETIVRAYLYAIDDDPEFGHNACVMTQGGVMDGHGPMVEDTLLYMLKTRLDEEFARMKKAVAIAEIRRN